MTRIKYFDIIKIKENYYAKKNYNSIIYDYKDRQLSELKIQNIEDIKIFGEWMYNNSTIYLNRKKDIYNNFLEHYNFN